jgi:hypothetical protein
MDRIGKGIDGSYSKDGESTATGLQADCNRAAAFSTVAGVRRLSRT